MTISLAELLNDSACKLTPKETVRQLYVMVRIEQDEQAALEFIVARESNNAY